METTFAKWLREHDVSPNAYAAVRGVHRPPILRLAGVRAPGPMRSFYLPTLQKVEEDTGIPIETLIREAVEAAKNPVPPRHYNRKGEDERADA